MESEPDGCITRLSTDWGQAHSPLFDINEEHGRVSLRSLYAVPTMITNGRWDLRFNSQFLDESLAPYTDVLTSVVDDPLAPTGVERPGELVFTFGDGLPYGPGATRVVPHPAYDAGHSVSQRAPAALRADVQSFLATGALP